MEQYNYIPLFNPEVRWGIHHPHKSLIKKNGDFNSMPTSVKGADPPPAEHSAAAELGVTWSCPELLRITNLKIIF